MQAARRTACWNPVHAEIGPYLFAFDKPDDVEVNVVSLVDIGVNLTHDAYDPDRNKVIESAAAAGVEQLIITGTDVQASQTAIDLATSAPGRLFATAGVHPHHAGEFEESDQALLREMVSNPCVVAVGECGLDYFRGFSEPIDQRQVFEMHLELASHAAKPVFLHQRDAMDDFLDILRPARSRLVGGVAHCFTGDVTDLAACLELDLYIGITGWICDERRGGALREAVSHLPLDRLLLETDAPYLVPRDLPEKPRGRRNEPRFLPHILATVAACMGLDVAKVGRASSENAERLFNLSNAVA